MHKRFILIVLISSAVLMAMVGGCISIIDPFFHYHKPLFGMQPLVNNEDYQNPGVAKNFDYDSLITGSSMTQNMRASWFDELFQCKSVKLPYAGGQSKNYSAIFEIAFQHGNIKNVFYGLDIYALTSDAEKTRNPLPEYLYNSDPLDDTNYLLNKTVFFGNAIPMVELNRANKVPSMDEAFVWEKRYTFSKKDTLATYARRKTPAKAMPESAMLEIGQENLNNLLAYIKNHQDTTFTVFLPPYSILYWDFMNRSGRTPALFPMLDQTIDQLLDYGNVRLYLYLDDTEIITNLDNYKDYTHFSPAISKYIVQSMAEDKRRLTADNYRQRLDDFQQFVEQYDYDSIFK